MAAVPIVGVHVSRMTLVCRFSVVDPKWGLLIDCYMSIVSIKCVPTKNIHRHTSSPSKQLISR